MKYLSSRFTALFIAVTLLGTSLLGYGAAPALAAVGLTSFEVAPGNGNSELVVTWTTETEVDIIAFLLKRAAVQDPNVATEAARMPALGVGVGGSSYEHRDRDLTGGTRYYYWLYEVNTSGDVVLLTSPINGTPGEAQPTATPSATPTGTRPPTATATQPATATPTATTSQAAQSGNNAPQSTNTPQPTNTQQPTNTPISTDTTAAAAAAANPPAATNTPLLENNPEASGQTTPSTNSTNSVAPDSASAPVVEGEVTPESNADSPERTEQGVDALTAQDAAAAPTDLTAVDTATAQAVAENNPQVTAAASDAQPTVVRPTATPRPSRSDDSGSTTGLLAVIGGGSLLAAALLALVAFFIWRRR